MTLTLTVTDRHLLRALNPQSTAIVPQGRIMCCHGRKVLGCRGFDQIAVIPKDTYTVCLAPADYVAIMEG
jgi:hypothetical protein